MEQASRGQRVADAIANTVGSWRFIIFQSIFLICWILFNTTAVIFNWDPYPFILMNLLLSTEGAYTASMIIMSQNRQTMMDRELAKRDFWVNSKAKSEIEAVLKHLEYQDRLIIGILNKLEVQVADIEHETTTREQP